MSRIEPIAIVGFAARLPGSGADLNQFWSNVAAAADCSRDVHDDRWTLPASRCVDPRATPRPDAVPHSRVYALEPFAAETEGLAIPQGFLDQLDPLFHLVLDVGRRAWQSTQSNEDIDRSQVGVILGNICLPTDRANDLARFHLGDRPTKFLRPHPFNRYVAGAPAGLLAQSLGFGGAAYTLDAACASSLYAVKLACDELMSGRATAMIAGGVCRPDNLYTQMGFAQLRALSAQGRCSPFDANADGLMVGEGGGMFVLKRLADAERDGDQIAGVITGWGLSNDTQGNLLAPAVEGQLRAMRAAYAMAGWKPNDVDLIECHATGTPVGDAVEFQSLRELWGPEGWAPGQCVIGSVKSTVGHLLTGAGSAALTKVLLALRHRQRPPQANFISPSDELRYHESPFKILQTAEEWQLRDEYVPRRAAVSGFGFGGVNAHLLVEEYRAAAPQSVLVKSFQAFTKTLSGASSIADNRKSTAKTKSPSQADSDLSVPIAIVGIGAHVGPWKTTERFREFAMGGGTPAKTQGKVNGWNRAASECPPGHLIEKLTVPLDRFRIPPRELEEMLPQQILMLQVASEALTDAHVEADEADPRTGVFVGLGLDLNTTNYHLRWAKLAETGFDQTVQHEPEAHVGPPLTADRTMGALGSITASRIARTFHFGGPSFTVCSEETSSGTALEIAVRALRNLEIDSALVGGVDFTADPRQLLSTADAGRPCGTEPKPLGEQFNSRLPAEGAVAVVLKRLADAENDGDRICAVIRGVGTASGGEAGRAASDARAYATALIRACADAVVNPDTIEYLEGASSGAELDDRIEADSVAAWLSSTHRLEPLHLSSLAARVGHTGSASCLLSVVRAAFSLRHRLLPPTIDTTNLCGELAGTGDLLRHAARPIHWLAEQNVPRRASVAGLGAGGSAFHAVLEEYSDASTSEPCLPLGARPEALFVVDGKTASELVDRLNVLGTWLTHQPPRGIEFLARSWYREVPSDINHKLAVSFVARSAAELADQVGFAANSLRSRPDQPIPSPGLTDLRAAFRDRIFYNPTPLIKPKVAFVFPGSGCHFAGMGREFGTHWPEILHRQQHENQHLRGQYEPDRFWTETIPTDTMPGHFLFGQVALGTLITDLLTLHGLKPDALIGHSLGESAGLFGLRIWADRDEMLRRVRRSSLFVSDLASPYNSARRHFGLSPGEPLAWECGLVTATADDVRSHLRPELRAYLLIVNTPNECVIGGVAADVQSLAASLDSPYVPLTGVTLAHCEAGNPVERAYRELHTLPTTFPPGLKVYSGAWARAYTLNTANAAESLAAGLVGTIDFPATIESAYRDGVRVFIEIGPGSSCTRMVSAILGERPHLARAVCAPRQDSVSAFLRTLARLISERIAVDLAALYGGPPQAADHREPIPAPANALVISVGQPPPSPPPLRSVPESPREEAVGQTHADSEVMIPPEPLQSDAEQTDGNGKPQIVDVEIDAFATPDRERQALHEQQSKIGWASVLAPVVVATASSQSALAEAHEYYLRVQHGYNQTAFAVLAVHNELIRRLAGDKHPWPPQPPIAIHIATGSPASPNTHEAHRNGDADSLIVNPLTNDVPRHLSVEDCTTFAVGRIGAVLGPTFAEIDSFPTRVRLPAGPLMLVDRVLMIEGDPLSMSSGRVVTEHVVRPDRWYLDDVNLAAGSTPPPNARCPTSITVESGQADLFLSAFLGIDFQTRGLAVYRLLDAVVTFHRGLPCVGERIEYDISIDSFFRQADSWLFRFRFEGSIAGVPLLSMQNGIAGFFTPAALAAGQGIVHTALDLQPLPGKKPADWRTLVPFRACSLTAYQVRALHSGDFNTAFGTDFSKVQLGNPMRLPAGMLRLVDRVTEIDPAGGRFGLGFVRAEYDIRPAEWFIECHFVDDKVMPGTLMYECCLHTLRIFLMRMGWVAEESEAVCEPVPEVGSRLKCRGQVLQSTGTVTYEVSIKELGYRPEPYCIADALMYADGKPIVEITNLSLRMSGLNRKRLEEIWGLIATENAPESEVDGPFPVKPSSPQDPCSRFEEPVLLTVVPRHYDSASIRAYSNGKPSEAFGAAYRVFDHDRVIARLPGPPFQFLDRISSVQGEPFELKAGAACVAEYAVPPGEWYFEANRCRRMPFCVLLEIALQPCGWLAAYCGSALTSDVDMSFRNLGGTATLFTPIPPDVGTLTTNVTLTKSSQSAGMLIQHYDMTVSAGSRVVYQGNTYFGFFTKAALSNQVGMTTAKVPYLDADQLVFVDAGELPHEPPFPAPMLRMVDRIDGYLPRGGSRGLGLIQGRIAVDPEFWFFKAHFYQDPVWPGSLGLESFLQLLKYVAWKRWRFVPADGWQTVAVNTPHSWTYRGQVLPTDKEVVVVLEVTAADDDAKRLTADGFLTIDGRVIYQMSNFTLDCN